MSVHCDIEKGDTFEVRETGEVYIVTEVIKPRVDAEGHDTGVTTIAMQSIDAWRKEQERTGE